jgi:hypothetical protein
MIGNIISFPTGNNGINKYKLETLRKLVVNNGSDMVLLSEHNKKLKTLSFHNQPAEIM